MSIASDRAKTIDVLRQAKALISEPSSWSQGAMARNAEGKARQPNSPQAVKFCAVGAVHRAMGIYMLGHRLAIWVELSRALPRHLARFNDTHTHAEVLALFDKAIESLESVGDTRVSASGISEGDGA